MTSCRRVRNGQQATVKQHLAAGDQGHLVCSQSVFRAIVAVTHGRRQAERTGVTPRIARTSTFPRVYRLCRNERLRRSVASFVKPASDCSPPVKTRHQKLVSETGGRNGTSVAEFRTRRLSQICEMPSLRAVLSALQTVDAGDQTGWLGT